MSKPLGEHGAIASPGDGRAAGFDGVIALCVDDTMLLTPSLYCAILPESSLYVSMLTGKYPLFRRCGI